MNKYNGNIKWSRAPKQSRQSNQNDRIYNDVRMSDQQDHKCKSKGIKEIENKYTSSLLRSGVYDTRFHSVDSVA